MGEYLVGNPVTLWEQFVDADGVPADPTTITFYVRDPIGDIVAYTMGVDAEVVKTTNDIPGNPFFGATDGFYECRLGTTPQIPGTWFYRPVGTGAVQAANEYEFTMIGSSTLSSITNEPSLGPFLSWCDPDDVISICPDASGSDTAILEGWIQVSSEVLYLKSGRQFSGLSQPTKVRPPNAGGCGCWPWNETWHSWGQVQWGLGASWGWDYGLGRWGCGGNWYGCSPLSQVKLAGYPVREIVQVKVDGDVVDPALYRLDEFEHLVHARDLANPDRQLFWPSCQIMDLPDTEPGTFSVTYRYGIEPPQSGKVAAAALACELWKAYQGAECNLPSGVRRATRQSVTIDVALFAQWQRDASGAWSVGIAAVDTFLNAVNPNGLRRRPTVWSPMITPYPLRPGV